MVAAPGDLGFAILGLVALAVVAYLAGLLWEKKEGRGFSVVATMVAVGFIALMVASYGSDARDSGFGKPATSLEPGAYEVYDVRVVNEEIYLVAAKTIPKPPSEPRFVKLAAKNLESFPEEAGTYMIVKVTRCFAPNDCRTRLDFVPIK